VPLKEGSAARPMGGWLERHRGQFRLGLKITVGSGRRASPSIDLIDRAAEMA
jgi:hypothetical protein